MMIWHPCQLFMSSSNITNMTLPTCLRTWAGSLRSGATEGIFATRSITNQLRSKLQRNSSYTLLVFEGICFDHTPERQRCTTHHRLGLEVSFFGACSVPRSRYAPSPFDELTYEPQQVSKLPSSPLVFFLRSQAGSGIPSISMITITPRD
jgi:hypothetical protein